jgi:hypothetical protein
MLGSILKAAVRLARVAVAVSVVSVASAALAQAVVDCTGTMTPGPNIYPSLTAYINQVGPVGTVQIVGTCHENVTIWGGDQFTIVGPGAINGHVSINNSPDAIFLKNLTITNPNGDGVDISGSKVSFDSCNVSNNSGNGVSINNASHVDVVGIGSFNNNAGWAGGFEVFGHSFLNIAPSPGPVEIRGNGQAGIRASQADVSTDGNTIISDTVSGPGIVLLGGSRAQIGSAIGGPNLIQNNPNGGISLQENSEISLWSCCSFGPNVVSKNGKFGISAGLHSQVTLAGADVNGNSGPGVIVYSGSQLNVDSGTQNAIDGNGSSADPMSAGIRIDGNSEAYLRGGDISNNLGPGIRVGVNSSADFAGVTIIGNSSVIACDFTSPIVSDVSVPWTTGCLVVRKN